MIKIPEDPNHKTQRAQHSEGGTASQKLTKTVKQIKPQAQTALRNIKNTFATQIGKIKHSIDKITR